MKILIVSILLSVLSPNGALAQVQDPSFYVITSRGCPSYLLGTVHVPVAFSEFRPDVHGALVSSRKVWIERKRDPRGIAGVWSEFLEHYPPSPAGAKKLGPEQIELLIAVGMPPPVANLLTEDDNVALAILEQSLGDPEFLDRALERLAVDHEIPIHALDDRLEWRKLMLAERKGMPMLLLFLQPQTTPDALRNMFAWRAQRAKTKYLEGERNPVDYESADLARHERWIHLLEPDLDAGGLFIAVGNSHVHGAGSLRERIQSLGYDVRKITDGRVGQFEYDRQLSD